MASLLGIMARLRDPAGGCPWDLEQDFASIAPYTIEEAYEVADAIDRGDHAALKDELGDLLLQVVFHSQMAHEQGLFSFADVVQAICDKMIRRHPHVFANEEMDSAPAVSANWEAIKASERRASMDGDNSALSGVARALPALMRAQKIQKRAAATGFDWPDSDGAEAKLIEEIGELRAAAVHDDRFEEAGDLLFAAVNVLRHYGIDAETALKAGTAKFERRFRSMERSARAADQAAAQDFAQMSLADKETLWQQAKQFEKKS